TSASTASLSARSQGSSWTRRPSSPANIAKASRRVPEIATVAPCWCSARAIAPPMPPLAPVTSAHLPVRSNVALSFASVARRLERAPPPRGGARPAVGCGGDALDQRAQPLAGAALVEGGTPPPRHERDRLAPTHVTRDLVDQPAHDQRRLGGRLGQH